jgi:cold-inducible RNA-binding protein
MPVRLFVGNLPYDVSEAELRAHFAALGPLSSLVLPTDRDTGKPRGFAFVEFQERADAEEAIRRLNHQAFKGRPLAVSEARAGGAGAPACPVPQCAAAALRGGNERRRRPSVRPRRGPTASAGTHEEWRERRAGTETPHL